MILLLTVFCGDALSVPGAPSNTQVPSLQLGRLPGADEVKSNTTSSLNSSASSTGSGELSQSRHRRSTDWEETLAKFAAARETK